MIKTITDLLRGIEREQNIKILLAVESGSRAWGFASPDSDYDVRFIYSRSREDYLKLEPMRDVIELPISGMLDISGWDLQKALRLMRGSNPTVFEWMSSPIVYIDTGYAEKLRRSASGYFSEKKSLYHYVSMAKRTLADHFTGETVRAKKYFYALRPLLACRWILDRHSIPPMLFSELEKACLPAELTDEIARLLFIKQSSDEVKTIRRIKVLDDYIETSIEEISTAAKELPDARCDTEKLDRLFLEGIA